MTKTSTRSLAGAAAILALALPAAGQLPNPGVELDAQRAALVITDPQNDFLSPEGVTWGVVGKSVTENKTVENIETLLNPGLRLAPLLLPHRPRLEVRRRPRSADAQDRHVQPHVAAQPRRLQGLRRRLAGTLPTAGPAEATPLTTGRSGAGLWRPGSPRAGTRR